MALQDKKIMPPPWLAHREIERYSIGWRMGYGEDYIYRFGDWLDTLSPEEQAKYRALFPEPVTWKGWWDDEDNGEVLEHGDFFVEMWQPEGRPKYTRQWLQSRSSFRWGWTAARPVRSKSFSWMPCSPHRFGSSVCGRYSPINWRVKPLPSSGAWMAQASGPLFWNRSSSVPSHSHSSSSPVISSISFLMLVPRRSSVL